MRCGLGTSGRRNLAGFLVILKSGSIQSTDVRPGLWLGRDQVRGETEGRCPGFITPTVKTARGLSEDWLSGSHCASCHVYCPVKSRADLGVWEVTGNTVISACPRDIHPKAPGGCLKPWLELNPVGTVFPLRRRARGEVQVTVRPSKS